MLSLGQSQVWNLSSFPTQITTHSPNDSVLHCRALQKGAGHPQVGGSHTTPFSQRCLKPRWVTASFPEAGQEESTADPKRALHFLVLLQPGLTLLLAGTRSCRQGSGHKLSEATMSLATSRPSPTSDQLWAWPTLKVSAPFHHFCCYSLTPFLNDYQGRVPRMLIANEAGHVKTQYCSIWGLHAEEKSYLHQGWNEKYILVFSTSEDFLGWNSLCLRQQQCHPLGNSHPLRNKDI